MSFVEDIAKSASLIENIQDALADGSLDLQDIGTIGADIAGLLGSLLPKIRMGGGDGKPARLRRRAERKADKGNALLADAEKLVEEAAQLEA